MIFGDFGNFGEMTPAANPYDMSGSSTAVQPHPAAAGMGRPRDGSAATVARYVGGSLRAVIREDQRNGFVIRNTLIPRGFVLRANEYVISPAKNMPGAAGAAPPGFGTLIMQGDGNLVVYAGQWDYWLGEDHTGANYGTRAGENYGTAHPGTGELWWHANTHGIGNYAVFQADGNLVVYNKDNRVLWASNTNGRGQFLSVQSDGNLVISMREPRVSDAGDPIWSCCLHKNTGFWDVVGDIAEALAVVGGTVLTGGTMLLSASAVAATTYQGATGGSLLRIDQIIQKIPAMTAAPIVLPIDAITGGSGFQWTLEHPLETVGIEAGISGVIAGGVAAGVAIAGGAGIGITGGGAAAAVGATTAVVRAAAGGSAGATAPAGTPSTVPTTLDTMPYGAPPGLLASMGPTSKIAILGVAVLLAYALLSKKKK
jgi:hypothetical protein